MTVACTVLAALWLAVVTGGAVGDPPDRCCPSLFKVEPNPPEYHFRCETASWTDSCDDLAMKESLGNTMFDTESGANDEMCNSKNYIMTDWNWQEPFKRNIACAYYLPPVEGCLWRLELVKRFDPIEGDDNCDCSCEDNVLFEEVDGQVNHLKKETYCDFTDPPESSTVGWCANNIGPDNVYGLLPFTTDVNTGVRTTFRTDNIEGTGEGAYVFAYAVPAAKKRSVRQPQPPSTSLTPRQRAYCWKQYILCKYRKCNYPCECYTNTRQRVTCSLYAIFTDATGRNAKRYYRSPIYVIRRAARLALSNIRRFGRPIPTFSQLRRITSKIPTPTPTTYTRPSPTTSNPTTRPPRPIKTHPPRYPPRTTTPRPPRYPPRPTTPRRPRPTTPRPPRYPPRPTTPRRPRYPPRPTTPRRPRPTTPRPPRYPPRPTTPRRPRPTTPRPPRYPPRPTTPRRPRPTTTRRPRPTTPRRPRPTTTRRPRPTTPRPPRYPPRWTTARPVLRYRTRG